MFPAFSPLHLKLAVNETQRKENACRKRKEFDGERTANM